MSSSIADGDFPDDETGEPINGCVAPQLISHFITPDKCRLLPDVEDDSESGGASAYFLPKGPTVVDQVPLNLLVEPPSREKATADLNQNHKYLYHRSRDEEQIDDQEEQHKAADIQLLVDRANPSASQVRNNERSKKDDTTPVSEPAPGSPKLKKKKRKNSKGSGRRRSDPPTQSEPRVKDVAPGSAPKKFRKSSRNVKTTQTTVEPVKDCQGKRKPLRRRSRRKREPESDAQCAPARGSRCMRVMVEEISGCSVDLLKTFDQIFNVFTLGENDITAVSSRIGEAKQELTSRPSIK